MYLYCTIIIISITHIERIESLTHMESITSMVPPEPCTREHLEEIYFILLDTTKQISRVKEFELFCRFIEIGNYVCSKTHDAIDSYMVYYGTYIYLIKFLDNSGYLKSILITVLGKIEDNIIKLLLLERWLIHIDNFDYMFILSMFGINDRIDERLLNLKDRTGICVEMWAFSTRDNFMNVFKYNNIDPLFLKIIEKLNGRQMFINGSVNDCAILLTTSIILKKEKIALKIIEKFTASELSLNYVNRAKRCTTLMMACHIKEMENVVIKMLEKFSATELSLKYAGCDSNCTALMIACRRFMDIPVKMMIDKFSAEELSLSNIDGLGFSSFASICYTMEKYVIIKAVEKFSAKELLLNHYTIDGDTAFFLVMKRLNTQNIISKMIEKYKLRNLNINHKNKKGISALMYAKQHGIELH